MNSLRLNPIEGIERENKRYDVLLWDDVNPIEGIESLWFRLCFCFVYVQNPIEGIESTLLPSVQIS